MGTQVNKGEIYIGGTYFPILDPVRVANITVPPNPILFGDTSQQSETQVESQLSQSAWIGGSGIYKGNSRTDTERSWYTDWDDRFRDGLRHKPKVNSIGSAAAGTINWTREFQGDQWANFGTLISRYSFADLAWHNETFLPAVPTDGITWTVAGSVNLYVAFGTGYARRVPGGTWVTNASAGDETSWFTINDGRIWRAGVAASTGQWTLYSSSNGTSWTTEGALPADVVLHQLTSFRDANGDPQVYGITNYGLYVYDDTNNVWKDAEMLLPRTSDSLKATRWRDAKLYMLSGGLGMVAVQAGSPLVVEAMGLDRDDGVPAAEQGRFVAVDSDVNAVLALVDGSVGSQAFSHHSAFARVPFHNAYQGEQYPKTEGPATLRAWNGSWHKLAIGSSSSQPRPVLNISTAGNLRRAYFSLDGINLSYIDLPQHVLNPKHAPANVNYETDTIRHRTPWWSYSADQHKKIHGHFFIETKNCSANRYVKVYYLVDLDDTTTTLIGTITTDGLQELKPGGNTGKTGRWFAFLFEGGGDAATPTVSQEIRLYTSETMRILPATYTYGVIIDLTRNWRGKTPSQMRLAIEALMSVATTPDLYEISYKDPYSPRGATQSRYGRIMRYNGEDYTGETLKDQGSAMLSLVIPYNADTS